MTDLTTSGNRQNDTSAKKPTAVERASETIHHELENKSLSFKHTHERLLEILQSQYEEDESILADMNLGDYLNIPDSNPFTRVNVTHFRKGKTAILKFMIENLKITLGADSFRSKLNERDSTGTTLLSKAIQQKRLDCVTLLLENGIQIIDDDIKSEIKATLSALSRPESKTTRELKDCVAAWHFFRSCPVPDFSMSYVGWKRTGIRTTLIADTTAFPTTALREGFDPWDWWEPPLNNEDYELISWIHLPSTNGLHLFVLLRTIQMCNRAWKKLLDCPDLVEFFYRSFQPPSVDPRDPLLNYREPGYWSEDSIGGLEPFREIPCKCAAIVFPCLILDSFQSWQRRRKIHNENAKCMRKLSSDANATIQVERTLDEAYYPGLSPEELQKRNHDQVVTKKLETTGRSMLSSKPILLVSQLWLWRVGSVIVSAHSSIMEPTVYDSQTEQYVPQKYEPATYFPDLQVGLIIADHISRFGKASHVGDTTLVPVLDIFENGVVSILSELMEYMDTTTAGWIEYKKERIILHEISDIRMELAMVKNVLNQQMDVLNSLLKDHRDDLKTATGQKPSDNHEYEVRYRGAKGSYFGKRAGPHLVKDWSTVERAQILLQQYEKRVEKIDGDAERIEKSIQNNLDLKRTYASVKEAHNSLILSTAVIGFTVITIIFAPLAFLTALFALKIDGFDKLYAKPVATTATGTAQDDASGQQDDVYDRGKIAGIFVSSEVLTILLTLAAVRLSLWYIDRWGESDRTKSETPSNQVSDTSSSDQKGKGKMQGWWARIRQKMATRDTSGHNRPESRTNQDDEEAQKIK